MKKHVALIGMMGAGKTTVGALVAEDLGWRFLDSDAEVQRISGLSVTEFFEAKGEPAFREAEAAAIREAATSKDPVIIGVGGGAVLREDTQQVLRANCLIIWMSARVATLLSRVGDGSTRPLLEGNPTERLRDILNERENIYKSLAQATVEVDSFAAEEIASAIAVMIRDVEVSG